MAKQTDIYCNKDHSREEIDGVVSHFKSEISKELQNPEHIRVQLSTTNNPRNRLFKVINPQFNHKEEVLEFLRRLELTDFCHSEEDSKFKGIEKERFYCFNIESDLEINLKLYESILKKHEVETVKEVLLKFKSKVMKNGEIIYIASLHYPTSGKTRWIRLWSEK
ncbi:MAG: hypothetical protein ACRC7N_12045 [Clostridium sp.]